MKTCAAIGAVAVSMLAGSAAAADLPSAKVQVASSPAVVSNWSGLYLGLNAGVAFGGGATQTLGFDLSGIVVGPVNAAQMNGAGVGGRPGAFAGGGQIGWNWQSDSMVAGFEADIQGLADADATRTQTGVVTIIIPLTTTVSTTRRLDYLGTVRGRIGWDIAPGWLLYATAGVAYGGVSASTRTLQSNIVGFGVSAGGTSGIRAGWTGGAGVEWAFSRNWSAKLEYLHYDLGRMSYAQPALASIGAPIYAAVSTSFRETGNLVRAGVNYRFGGGGAPPIVASY